jgi:hypothetical protein
MNPVRAVAAVAVALAASVAFAQAPAPAAAPEKPAAPAATPVDNSSCGKPDAHPGKFASPQKMRQWNSEVSTWQDCMKKYIADLQTKADAAAKTANALIADSNNAIASYNATVKDLQAQVEAAK